MHRKAGRRRDRLLAVIAVCAVALGGYLSVGAEKGRETYMAGGAAGVNAGLMNPDGGSEGSAGAADAGSAAAGADDSADRPEGNELGEGGPAGDRLAVDGPGGNGTTKDGTGEGGPTKGGSAGNRLSEDGAADAPLVVLDPGHGGIDDGCVGNAAPEKDINLAIALLVRDRLAEKGCEVLLTREEDTWISPEERAAFANDSGADLFVSIHQNAYEDASAQGIETWYAGAETDRTSEDRRLARLIQQETVASCGARDREARGDADSFVLKNTSMPSCLVETGFLSNGEEGERLSDGAYQEKLADGIAEGIDLYLHPKTMYLTFDDGPSAENTGRVLDILKEYGVHATFFVVGTNVRRNPDVAKRIVEEGHTIGIHCNEHRYDEIYESTDSYLADFQEAYDAVYETTGVEPVLFRFPGGSINSYNKEVYEDIIAAMSEKGYIYFDWNASLEDAVKNPDPEKLLRNAKETTLGRRKVVMLAHDIIGSTVECLPELLDLFPEYRMEPLSPDVAPVQF